jgi:RNA polymerase sigma-70 factor (ECF subfamily)
MQPVFVSSGDDRELVARVRAGDERAFEMLFLAHYEALCDSVYRIARSHESAQELVHDVLSRVWQQRAEWIVDTSVRAYLFAAARNHAVSHLRRRHLERQWRQSVLRDPVGGPAVAENGGEAWVRSAELARAVREVLAGLPERCRVAFALRWQHQLSYGEIAHVMGISLKTVEGYLTRATAALRARADAFLPHR